MNTGEQLKNLKQSYLLHGNADPVFLDDVGIALPFPSDTEELEAASVCLFFKQSCSGFSSVISF